MTNTLGLTSVNGGVVGNFTPIATTIDIADKPELGVVGANKLGIKVPAGKFLVGAYIKNTADDADAAGTGTLSVTVGDNALTTAKAVKDLKGTGLAAIKATPVFLTAETDVTLTVATAAVTKGTFTICVIYA